jgi:CMP-N,N'-diacetyllegionaminic acid synthase
MYNDKTILAVVTARGGSKGLPRKNVREICGKPLIAWTIEAAKESKFIDRCILSSDDQEIIEIAKQYGCDVPFVRPADLAQDESNSIDVILHAIDNLEHFHYIVLLQPTSPLRNSEDIDGCIELCVMRGAKAVVSVSIPEKSPFWMFEIDKETSKMRNILGDKITVRRQELQEIMALNGAVYIADCDWVKQSKSFFSPETLAHEMPKQRSFDIDTELDFNICQYLLKDLTK